MKPKNVTARLEQDMAEAQALGDMNAVAMIAMMKKGMFEIRDERLFQNLEELISDIKQHINEHPTSYKVLSFTLALCYLNKNRYRHQLSTSDKSTDTLQNFLNIMIDTDNILQLPHLPAGFVRQAKAEQEKEVKTLRAFLKKTHPEIAPGLLTLLHLEPGRQARKLLVEGLPVLAVRTEQAPSQAEQPAAAKMSVNISRPVNTNNSIEKSFIGFMIVGGMIGLMILLAVFSLS